jgi:hypothetical protein
MCASNDDHAFDSAHERLSNIRALVQAWEQAFGEVAEWPVALKLSELKLKESDPAWTDVSGHLARWIGSLREHAFRGEELLRELSQTVEHPLPQEEWAIRDVFRQFVDLTQTVSHGVQSLRAREAVVHLHYHPPGRLVYDGKGSSICLYPHEKLTRMSYESSCCMRL